MGYLTITVLRSCLKSCMRLFSVHILISEVAFDQTRPSTGPLSDRMISMKTVLFRCS